MKKKILFAFVALLGMGVFTACSDDDDNDTPSVVEKQYVDALNKLYPKAKDVEWKKEAAYTVAEFNYPAEYVGVDVWFDGNASWMMTSHDYGKNLFFLPPIVEAAFNTTDYSTWTVDDIEYYEYPVNTKNFYLIEVEKQGEPDANLFFKEDGTLIKTVSGEIAEITPDTAI